MINQQELKQQAIQLRKKKRYNEALPKYEKLWDETGDEYDGAGLLSCLRKLGLFDRAIPFADELIEKFPDFQWCKNEVIWTYIAGILNKLKEDVPLEKVIDTSKKIMSLNPEGLAAKMAVFKVLKLAKASNNWDTVDEWVVKLTPESLSTEPMIDSKGREGWCDQSLWYNYRIKSLIEKDRSEQALEYFDGVIEKFPIQKKFFQRLKALAHYKLKNLNGAETIYSILCSGYKPDWWLLHEYARVLRDKGSKVDALKMMYQAVSINPKLETMVNLLIDIGMLCKEMKKDEEARAHFVLSSLLRDEKGWSIPKELSSAISELNGTIGDKKEPSSIKEALSMCHKAWESLLGDSYPSKSKRKPRKELNGKIIMGKSDLPFCFIKGEGNDSYFCSKSYLPNDIKDGDKVVFNAIPSFDKKKNKESWKAIDIRKA